MTLSIDDLVKAYTKVYWAIPSMDGDSARIAGIRAVVTALRDENRHWIDADKMFDKILASRGDEAAGGSDRKDERSADAGRDLAAEGAVSTPAAAPDVCEWIKHRHGWTSSCDGQGGWWGAQKRCPSCNRPIKFVEAAR